jgi:hypothetical protein
MSSFKEYFTYDCISFSLLMLIYSALGLVNYFPQPNTFTVFELFAMTSCVVILMFFTDNFFHTSKSLLRKIIVDIIDTLFSVFILGIAFNMLSFSWKNVLSITIMVFAIYFGVLGITIIKNQADADNINKKIRKIRNKSN